MAGQKHGSTLPRLGARPRLTHCTHHIKASLGFTREEVLHPTQGMAQAVCSPVKPTRCTQTRALMLCMPARERCHGQGQQRGRYTMPTRRVSRARARVQILEAQLPHLRPTRACRKTQIGKIVEMSVAPTHL